jgi:formate-dependent phosphoribosylglycinamide formyltransferase (GAR transformylase)
LDYTRHKNILQRSLYAFTESIKDTKAEVHYISYCKILRKVMQEATKQHYSRIIAKCNNKIKKSWNIILKETGKLHSVEKVPTLLANGEKLKDPMNVSDAFNNFFITITEK